MKKAAGGRPGGGELPQADITPRQRAMLDFAMKVCLHSDTLDDSDFSALHAHGFSDEDIWDIGAITAFFGLSNRMANMSGMLPNPEFYLLGRIPKQKWGLRASSLPYKTGIKRFRHLAPVNACCLAIYLVAKQAFYNDAMSIPNPSSRNCWPVPTWWRWWAVRAAEEGRSQFSGVVPLSREKSPSIQRQPHQSSSTTASAVAKTATPLAFDGPCGHGVRGGRQDLAQHYGLQVPEEDISPPSANAPRRNATSRAP